MTLSHYVDFTVEDADTPADEQDVISGIFASVHVSITKDGHPICIDFPMMKDTELGNTIRVMSNQEQLAKLMSHQYVEWITSRSEAVTSGIQTIPANHGHVSVVRIRPEDTLGAGAADRKIRRLKKRALARGEAWTIHHEKSVKEAFSEKGSIKQIAGLRVQSQSTKQSFRLMIERKSAKENNLSEYTGYGLCKTHSTVPEF